MITFLRRFGMNWCAIFDKAVNRIKRLFISSKPSSVSFDFDDEVYYYHDNKK